MLQWIWQTATSQPITHCFGKRMVLSMMKEMTDLFPPPRSTPTWVHLFYLTSVKLIRLKPRKFILIIGQPKPSLLVVRVLAYMQYTVTKHKLQKIKDKDKVSELGRMIVRVRVREGRRKKEGRGQIFSLFSFSQNPCIFIGC